MSSHFERQKYGFAIHSSSPQLGLALSNFAGNSRSQTWDLGRDLSTHLHQHLVEFIKPQSWADLAFIAVATGPGSFTSTRIGVVTARTMAQQLDIPLFGISTLAAVAMSHQKQISPHSQPLSPPERGEQEAIALQMPAQRGQLFTAIYQLSPSDLGLIELFSDTVLTKETWQQTLAHWPTSYQLIDIPADIGNGNLVDSLLELAYLNWQQGKRPNWLETLPFYGQHPVMSN